MSAEGRDPSGPGDDGLAVLLFAGLAETVGRSSLDVSPPLPETVGALVARLREEWPALSGATFRTAVNQRYASDDAPVRPGDELALIPPVSGG